MTMIKTGKKYQFGMWQFQVDPFSVVTEHTYTVKCNYGFDGKPDWRDYVTVADSPKEALINCIENMRSGMKEHRKALKEIIDGLNDSSEPMECLYELDNDKALYIKYDSGNILALKSCYAEFRVLGHAVISKSACAETKRQALLLVIGSMLSMNTKASCSFARDIMRTAENALTDLETDE